MIDVPLGGHGYWATTVIVAGNIPSQGAATPSTLLETNLTLDGHHLFGRLEYVRKTAHDLALRGTDEDHVFDIVSGSAGYLRDLVSFAGVTGGVGVRGSISVIDERLRVRYGTTFPMGWMVYVRLRPSAMRAPR